MGKNSTDLSLAQVADLLGCSKRRVQQFVRAGRLPARKIGNMYVVQSADAEAFERQPPGAPRKADAVRAKRGTR